MVAAMPADEWSIRGACQGTRECQICQGRLRMDGLTICQAEKWLTRYSHSWSFPEIFLSQLIEHEMKHYCSTHRLWGHIDLFSLQVEAENFPEISLQYEVVAVPTFIFLKVTTIHKHCSVHAIHLMPIPALTSVIIQFSDYTLYFYQTV